MIEKVYVQTNKGLLYQPSFCAAHYGFAEFYDCDSEFFGYAERQEIFQKIDPQRELIIGGVEVVREYFSTLGIFPTPLDYPHSLAFFLGRRVWRTTLKEFKQNIQEKMPVFIKSVDHKKIKGFVCRSIRDFVVTASLEEDTEIWCSDIVQFKAEFRCYVLNGELLGVFQYKGDSWIQPDLGRVAQMISFFKKESPIAYALDVGVTDGRTFLVEVNDSIALGSYGLSPHKQASMLEARWRELVKRNQ